MAYFWIILACIAIYIAIGFIHLKFSVLIHLKFSVHIGGWLAMCFDSRHGFPVWALVLALAMAILGWPYWIYQSCLPSKPRKKNARGRRTD